MHAEHLDIGPAFCFRVKTLAFNEAEVDGDLERVIWLPDDDARGIMPVHIIQLLTLDDILLGLKDEPSICPAKDVEFEFDAGCGSVGDFDAPVCLFEFVEIFIDTFIGIPETLSTAGADAEIYGCTPGLSCVWLGNT